MRARAALVTVAVVAVGATAVVAEPRQKALVAIGYAALVAMAIVYGLFNRWVADTRARAADRPARAAMRPSIPERVVKYSPDHFAVDLVDQHWGKADPERSFSAWGRVRIVLNGILVVDPDIPNDDWGISKTAVALSWTLLRDHDAQSPFPAAVPGDAAYPERLVWCICGLASTLVACGLGANWSVRHQGDWIWISDVVRSDDPSGVHLTALPEASCLVLRTEYERQVMRFVQTALDFAAGADKRIDSDWDRSEWEGWQAELRTTLAAVSARQEV